MEALKATLPRTFRPTVLVLGTDDAIEAAQRNGLSLADLFRPSADLSDAKITTTHASEHKKLLNNFHCNFVDLEDLDLTPGAVDLARISVLVAGTANDAPDLPPLRSEDDMHAFFGYSHHRDPAPWWSSYRSEYFAQLSLTEAETFGHPVAVLLLCTVSHPDPINAVNALFSNNNPPSMFREGFMDPNLAKFYVLLNDRAAVPAVPGDAAAATLHKMRKVFGLGCCKLLNINGAGPTGEPRPDIWTELRPWARRAPPVPQDVWDAATASDTSAAAAAAAAAVESINWTDGPPPWSEAGYYGGGSVISGVGAGASDGPAAPAAAAAPTAGASEPTLGAASEASLGGGGDELGSDDGLDHPLAHPLAGGDTAPPAGESGAVGGESGGGKGKGPAEPAAGVGSLLTDDELREIRTAVYEFARNVLVPSMEKKIRDIDTNVAADRRGLGASVGRWFRRAIAADTPDADSSGTRKLSFETDNVRIRRMGDLAFMLQDYEFARDQYKIIQHEFRNTARKYHAAVQDALGLACAILGDRDVSGYFDVAITTYCETQQFRYGRRSALLLYDILVAQGRVGDAVQCLRPLCGKRSSDLGAALALEQIALCALRYPSPWIRNYAFNMHAAAVRFQQCSQHRHALRCFRRAQFVFEGKRWATIDDALSASVAHELGLIGSEPDAVISALGSLLTNPTASASAQAAHLNDFLRAVVRSGDTIHELPLPVLDESTLSVTLCEIDYADGGSGVSERLGASSASLSASGPSITELGGGEPGTPSLRRGRAVTEAAGPGGPPTATTSTASSAAKAFRSQPYEEMEAELAVARRTPAEQDAEDEAAFMRNRAQFTPTVVVMGEPLELRFDVANPLAIPLAITDLSVMCELSPETPTSATREEFAAATAKAVRTVAAATDELPPFSYEPVSFALDPLERRTVSIVLTPQREGPLRILGFRFVLNSAVPGCRVFSATGRRLNNTKAERTAVRYAPDGRLFLNITTAMPRVVAELVESPADLVEGEVAAGLIRVTNTGQRPLTRLAIKYDRPDCVSFGVPQPPVSNPRDDRRTGIVVSPWGGRGGSSSKGKGGGEGGGSGASDADGGGRGGGADDGSEVVELEPTAAGVAVAARAEYVRAAENSIVHVDIAQLEPGDSIELPLWIQATTKNLVRGRLVTRFVFAYSAVETNKDMPVRFARATFAAAVRKCVDVAVDVLPHDDSTERYVVRVTARQKIAGDFAIHQVSSVSPEWRVQRLDSEVGQGPADGPGVAVGADEAASLYYILSRHGPVSVPELESGGDGAAGGGSGKGKEDDRDGGGGVGPAAPAAEGGEGASGSESKGKKHAGLVTLADKEAKRRAAAAVEAVTRTTVQYTTVCLGSEPPVVIAGTPLSDLLARTKLATRPLKRARARLQNFNLEVDDPSYVEEDSKLFYPNVVDLVVHWRTADGARSCQHYLTDKTLGPSQDANRPDRGRVDPIRFRLLYPREVGHDFSSSPLCQVPIQLEVTNVHGKERVSINFVPVSPKDADGKFSQARAVTSHQSTAANIANSDPAVNKSAFLWTGGSRIKVSDLPVNETVVLNLNATFCHAGVFNLNRFQLLALVGDEHTVTPHIAEHPILIEIQDSAAGGGA